jgi:hypothetical protein
MKIARRRPLRRPSKSWLGLLAVGIFLGMTGLFLVHSNEISTEGFSLRQLEAEAASLKREISQLRAQIATARSLDAVEKTAEDLGLVAVRETLHLSRGGTVALSQLTTVDS